MTAHTSCSRTTPALAPGDALGPIALGATLQEVQSLCTEVEYSWIRQEGRDYPVVIVGLGSVTALLEMSDTVTTATVRRISTSSVTARFDDGIGPGVSVAKFVEQWPDSRVVFGEGTFLMSEGHRGVGLAISMRARWDIRAAIRARDTGDLSELPERTHVSWILLHGG